MAQKSGNIWAVATGDLEFDGGAIGIGDTAGMIVRAVSFDTDSAVFTFTQRDNDDSVETITVRLDDVIAAWIAANLSGQSNQLEQPTLNGTIISFPQSNGDTRTLNLAPLLLGTTEPSFPKFVGLSTNRALPNSVALSAAVTSTNKTLTLPAINQDRYIWFALPEGREPYAVYLVNRDGVSHLRRFEKLAGMVVHEGDNYAIWMSDFKASPVLSEKAITISIGIFAFESSGMGGGALTPEAFADQFSAQIVPQGGLTESRQGNAIRLRSQRVYIGDNDPAAGAQGAANIYEGDIWIDTSDRLIRSRQSDATWNAGTPIGSGTTLPEYNQADEQGLKSRAGNLYWEPINEVPNTPGDASGIGHALTVTGENDRDYRWRAIVDAMARMSIDNLELEAASLARSIAGVTDALPDPLVPGHASEAKRFVLNIPADSGRSTWEEESDGGTGEPADNSITPAKAQADTDERKRAWRERLSSAHISAGTTLPALTAVNIGDVRVITQDVANGISFVDITDTATVLTSAESGDVMQALMFREKVWTRLGNILAGRAARQNAEQALANTRRIRPVSVWERNDVARTIYVEWKPRVAVALNAALAITVGGTPNNRANPEAVAAGSGIGVLLPIPISAVNAANITRSSGAIAGWVEIQITFGGVTDTTWMRAVAAPVTPPTFTRYANEAALPANVPANTIAWYPDS